jgi:putative transposase
MLGVPKMKPQTKREYLRDLVVEKNRWRRPLTDEEKASGFLGWHKRGYLPHCDFPGLVQFVTFRLADSMPVSRCGEWEHLLKIEDNREKRTKLEEYLDRGVGECHLRDPHIAKIAEDAMLYFHNERYEMIAWCVMPNHVHVLVHVWDWPLAKMLQNWKSITAVKINRILNRSGEFWQREYWETFMQSEEQERAAIRYIESNPVKAKLCQVAKEWPFSSARHRDKYNRLLVNDGAPSIARRW